MDSLKYEYGISVSLLDRRRSEANSSSVIAGQSSPSTEAWNAPTTATISGTKARIEIDGDFYAPSAFTLIGRGGESRRFEFATQGRGLHYEAAEVARCIRGGFVESPLMPLSESASIMRTMESILSTS